MKVLSILANPKTVEQSASLRIERAFHGALAQRRPDAQFENVDVYRDDIPQLDEKVLPAFFGVPPADTETARKMARREEMLKQFMMADVIVIATPMWNFSAPPMLKAYIDCVLVIGKTFRYTEKGPEGLMKGKRAVLCIASGGVYEGAMAAYDHLTPMLRMQLGFIGITDVTEIKAPGQALGEETAKANTAAAMEKAQAAAKAI